MARFSELCIDAVEDRSLQRVISCREDDNSLERTPDATLTRVVARVAKRILKAKTI